MNHSNTDPNCITIEDSNCYAKRDIEIGEQLFEDYRTFDHPEWMGPIRIKYDAIEPFYEIPQKNSPKNNVLPKEMTVIN